ncbi:MAG: class I SAM-dependent methyltransferase [Rickettsiaceae bacterium]|nr:class I SAM-dependent methyltransferase [Rickettsiaceae bacterium]
MIKNLFVRKFLWSLEKIKYGSLKLTTPEGKIYEFIGSYNGENADLKIHNWQILTKLVIYGDIGFTELYRDKIVETTNLKELLTFALRNDHALGSYIESNIFGRFFSKIIYLINTNTLRRSKYNIQKHYDLGNDFYNLWLDNSMTYSSGIFNSAKDDLYQAQCNKYQRIIDNINDSGSLLEIGCGWGGFMDHAMNHGDYQIKGITLSKSQLEYSRNRLTKYSQNVNVALEDYRMQQGKYDNIISIEMFEAVGMKYWSLYFGKIKELLAKNGKAIIQTITIDDNLFDRYSKGADMIRTYIFPGGMLPSQSIFENLAEKHGLKVQEIYKFGKDYSKTLDIWFDRFNLQYNQIKKMNFDDRFIRIWNFYLASCSACFQVERTNVMQVQLEHL